ncbi:sulfotransferase 1B1-like isoform X2 [Bacillus rossius redtenbacheri]|uniref:sulfotransferase 1B1-like isoform X2 n=1 Tax=Bacillus rossius redtenbacheri TaxID=93214 RepID=UPI002FDCE49C
MSAFPHQIVDVDSATNRELLHLFHGERTGFVQVGRSRWLLPSKYRRMAGDFYNFRVRPDDTWVVTFPRSGTTLTQEMVWLLGNNLDYKTASEVRLNSRFPFIEFPMLIHDEVLKDLQDLNQDSSRRARVEQMSRPLTEELDQATSGRFIKTHLPLDVLPPDLLTAGCKVVYVARNPLDVVVSGYHHNRRFELVGYKGDFPKYWNCFKKDLVMFSPYWAHVTEAWGKRHSPNMLFLFYEDIVKDMRAAIRRVADFLGTQVTEEQVAALAAHLHIDTFRKNPAIEPNSQRLVGLVNQDAQDFVRKGKTGGWTEEFTPEIVVEAENWMKENLSKTDLRFPL